MMKIFSRIAVLAIIFSLSDESKIRCPSPPFKLFVYKKDGNSLKNIAGQCNSRCLSSKGFLASRSLKNPICFNKIVKLKKLFVPQNHKMKYPCHCHYLNKYGEKSHVCHQPLSQNTFMTSKQCDFYCGKKVALFYSEVGQNMNLVACRNLDELVDLSTLTGCIQMRENEAICHCYIPVPAEDTNMFLDDDSLAPFIKSYDDAELGYFDPSVNDFRTPSEIDKTEFANRTISVSYEKGKNENYNAISESSDSVQFLHCKNKKPPSVEEKRSSTEKRTSLSKSSPQSNHERTKKFKIRRTSSSPQRSTNLNELSASPPTNVNAIAESSKKLKIRRTVSPSPQRSTNSNELSASPPTNVNAIAESSKKLKIRRTIGPSPQRSTNSNELSASPTNIKAIKTPNGTQIVESQMAKDKKSRDTPKGKQIRSCTSSRNIPSKGQGQYSCRTFILDETVNNEIESCDERATNLPILTETLNGVPLTEEEMCKNNVTAINSEVLSDKGLNSGEKLIKEATDSDIYSIDSKRASTSSKSEHKETSQTCVESKFLSPSAKFENGRAGESHLRGMEMSPPINNSSAPQSSTLITEVNQHLRAIKNDRNERRLITVLEKDEENEIPQSPRLNEIIRNLKLRGNGSTRKQKNPRKIKSKAETNEDQTLQANTIVNSKLTESRNDREENDATQLKDAKVQGKNKLHTANDLKTERERIPNVKLKFENCQLKPSSILSYKTSKESRLHFHTRIKPNTDKNDMDARWNQNDSSISNNQANLYQSNQVVASKSTTSTSNDSQQKTKTKLLEELEFDSSQNQVSTFENTPRQSLRIKNVLKTAQKKWPGYGDTIYELPNSREIRSHVRSKSESSRRRKSSKLKD